MESSWQAIGEVGTRVVCFSDTQADLICIALDALVL